MPFNLLILPLVGGYYVIANSEWYKYKTQRLHNERLLFNSVLAEVVLIIISLSLRHIATLWLPELVRLYRISKFDIDMYDRFNQPDSLSQST
jgi:hypothetical protein